MTSLIRRLAPRTEERDTLGLPFQQWVDYFKFGNMLYPTGWTQTLQSDREKIEDGYLGLARTAYKSNPVVFGCMSARSLLFSEARFQFRRLRAGRPGDLYGSPELGVLETPWPNGTTGDLLARMIMHADLAGNAYIVRRGNQLFPLRPDYTSILLGSHTDRPQWEPGDPDTEVVGYMYKPGGKASRAPEILFHVEEVAHFAPIQDPDAHFRGMSWLVAAIREIQADSMMTTHKSKFLEQGATVNGVVKVPAETVDTFNKWVDRLEEGHRGLANAYRTMYLGAGADFIPVGANMQQMDFKVVQAAGETRIALASRVPPAILGSQAGLEGSALNSGNYESAMLNFANLWARPTWRNAAGSLATIINVPPGSELWYDDRDIPALREDIRKAGERIQSDSASISNLVAIGGFTPESAVAAVTSEDLTRLVHSGLPSVQQQQPPAALPSNKPTNGASPNGNTGGTLTPTGG